MRCFRVENYNELRDYLQTRHIHDGFFHHAIYDQITKEFTVHVENNVWNDSLDMVFVDVCEFTSIADYKWGDNETINAFVLINSIEDRSDPMDNHNHKGKLHFVWEMFSGNRINIVCSELRIGSKTAFSVVGHTSE